MLLIKRHLLLALLCVCPISGQTAEESKPREERLTKNCLEKLPDQADIEWRVATEASNKIDMTGWDTRLGQADGKTGSNIVVNYRYTSKKVVANQIVTLKLGFSAINGKSAVAHIYPLDNASLAANDKKGIYIRLRPNSTNLIIISLVAPKKGGGVAVLTCQNGNSSIFSISLPGRSFTPELIPGTLSKDGNGSIYIKMQSE